MNREVIFSTTCIISNPINPLNTEGAVLKKLVVDESSQVYVNIRCFVEGYVKSLNEVITISLFQNNDINSISSQSVRIMEHYRILCQEEETKKYGFALKLSTIRKVNLKDRFILRIGADKGMVYIYRYELDFEDLIKPNNKGSYDTKAI